MVTPQGRELPVIDLRWLSSECEAERQWCVEAIGRAATEWGSFQVVNHGIRRELLEEMRREQVKLFEATFETKAHPGLLNNSYRWGTPTATSPAQFSRPEAFHVPLMKIYDSSSYGQFTSLAAVMMELAPAMSGLARMLSWVLAENLGHEGCNVFNEMCHENTCFLRLNHYPMGPLSPETFTLVPHVDNDFLTISHQDQVGGVQLLKDSRWVAVEPNRDALIVNIGPLLQAWSNDVYRRVEQKVAMNSEVERYSVAYSLCPSYDSQIRLTKRKAISCSVFPNRSKRTVSRNEEEEHDGAGISTKLTLLWEPWKFKKELTESDLGNLSRLLIPVDCLRAHVFPQMDKEMLDQVKNDPGMQVVGENADTGREHQFVFRCWSSGSYVLKGGWTKEFVEEQGLKVGDEIHMRWHPFRPKFYFSVVHRDA